jgi:hypothetical protein
MKPQLRVSTNPPLSTGHWLYELVVRHKYCGYRNVSTRDNYLMKDHAEYIDRLERSMAPDLWPILIDGGWGNAGAGAVYRGFNRTIHGAVTKPPLPPVALNPREPILWSLDFNVGLMCSVIAQVYHQQRRFDPTSLRNTFGAPPPVHLLDDYVSLESSEYQRNVLYVLDEIRIPNCGTPDVADEFIKRYGAVARQSGVIVYGDASAGGRSQQIAAQASARSNWAIIAEALKRAGIPAEFRVQTVNPSIMDRINAVKAQFRTKDGIGLHIDLDRCPYLAMDFESVNWREGTNDVDKDSDKTKTHLSDAVGYLIWMERSRAANMAINLLNPFKTAT